MKNDMLANKVETDSNTRTTKPGAMPADTVNVLMVSKRPHILAHRHARWARRAAHA